MGAKIKLNDDHVLLVPRKNIEECATVYFAKILPKKLNYYFIVKDILTKDQMHYNSIIL